MITFDDIKLDVLPEQDEVSNYTYVALDVELFKAEKNKLHRETGIFACLSMVIGDNIYVYTKKELVRPLLERLENKVWVMHESQFDLRQLKRWGKITTKKVWDTLIIEKLLYSGWYKTFGLKHVVRRRFNVILNKETRDEFSNTTELTKEQILYCALDSYYALKICFQQQDDIRDGRRDAFTIWKKVDLPAVWAYMDFRGFRIDVDFWKALYNKNLALANELDDFPFNPRSPSKVLEYLRLHGFPGLPSTGEKILKKAIRNKPDKYTKIVKQLLKYRKVAKLTSTYGMNFIEPYLEEEDGYYVIVPNYDVTGAVSGRNACSNPNMQNIPIRENPEFRQGWIARPNHKLIVCDWSAQEPRIQAFLSKDKNLIQIFNSGNDPYIETAKLFGRNINKSDPYRDKMKIAFLGATYGQTPFGIEKAHDIPKDEAEEILNHFWKVFPGSYKWYKKQKKISSFVSSVMGRRLWLNPYSYDKERKALNHPHQSTASDMMKMSIARLHKNWNYGCPFGVVGTVHDELILDVPEELAELIAKDTSEIMVSVAEEMCPGIPFVAKAKICDNWLEGK